MAIYTPLSRSLNSFLEGQVLTEPVPLLFGNNFVNVLTNLGERILRGIISCIVRAHSMGRSYKGKLTVQNLQVTGYLIPGTPQLFAETASVSIGAVTSHHLTVENQAADYTMLSDIIHEVFEPWRSPVAAIITETLMGLHEMEAQIFPVPAFLLLQRRSQLLQALAAMTDHLVMATMWWNLVRFKESLHIPEEILAFNDAVMLTGHDNWCNTVRFHPWFTTAFNHGNNAQWYKNQNNGQGLLHFARNWFTHGPGQIGKVRDLDVVFTHYFAEFMPTLLGRLYLWFDLLTFLVPPS